MKNVAKKLSIVIPAYNEEKRIGKVIQGIKEVSTGIEECEIIVVDDGSRDLTASIAEKSGVRVVRHPFNMGYGAALKSGIKAAKNQEIIFFDADDSFYPEDIFKLLEYSNDFDMVIGARTLKEGENHGRAFLRWLFTKFSSFLVGRKFRDVNSGFRFVKRSLVMKLLPLLPERFSITTTMSIFLFKRGCSIVEVPIAVKKQSKGNKLKVIRDGLGFPYLALRISMYYDPFKVFSPIVFLLLSLGLVKSIFDLLVIRNITDSSIFLALSGIQLLILALLGDLIVKIKQLPT
jgi:glycosyltransferase involved in cell wall biosynthesis